MEMSATTLIRRPPKEIYEFLKDIANDVRWRNGVDASGWRSDPPYGVGSIGYAKAGKMETVYRVTVLEPPRRVDWEFIEGPFVGRGGYRLEPVDGGTRFTLVADIKPQGMMRLVGPLFSWVGRRSNRKDVETLRQIMEHSPG
jgi:carbon monoxide dehydrogenase subunit G